MGCSASKVAAEDDVRTQVIAEVSAQLKAEHANQIDKLKEDYSRWHNAMTAENKRLKAGPAWEQTEALLAQVDALAAEVQRLKSQAQHATAAESLADSTDDAMPVPEALQSQLKALCEEAEDPIARIGELLSTHSKSSGGTCPPVAVSSPTPTSTATIGSSTPGGELPPSSRSAPPAMDQRVKLSLPNDEDAMDKWNLVGWARAPMPVTSRSSVPPLPHHHRHRLTAAISQVRGTGVHRVVAAAILRGAEHKGSSTDALAFLRSLKDESELAALFGNGPVADSMTEMLWPEVLKMQAASAATSRPTKS